MTITVTTPAGRALSVPPPVCLVAVVPSGSRQGRQHAIMRAVDSVGRVTYGCTCESGTFRPERECVHVAEFKARSLREGTVLTPEGYVVQGLIGDGVPAELGTPTAPAPVDPSGTGSTRIPGTNATYAVRSDLGRLGCTWDRATRHWTVPDDVRGQVLTLVASADRSARRSGSAASFGG